MVQHFRYKKATYVKISRLRDHNPDAACMYVRAYLVLLTICTLIGTYLVSYFVQGVIALHHRCCIAHIFFW